MRNNHNHHPFEEFLMMFALFNLLIIVALFIYKVIN